MWITPTKNLIKAQNWHELAFHVDFRNKVANTSKNRAMKSLGCDCMLNLALKKFI